MKIVDSGSMSGVRPRVLVVGGQADADSMENHVMEALTNLRCETLYVNGTVRLEMLGRLGNAVLHKAAATLLREPELLLQSRLLRAADSFQPSLIIVLQGNYLSPKTTARLRTRSSCPIVCWCQDQLSTLGRQYMLAAEYDAVFVKDHYMRDLFSNMIRSTRFHYLPEACNPRVHRSVPLSDDDRRRYACDIAIFGGMYYYRQEILRQLRMFDMKIRGHTPFYLINRLPGRGPGEDREVRLDDKVRFVSAARIALNPLHFAEINSLNCRAFELAGCGAFQLISSKPVLSSHFVNGVELDSFESIEELIEKVHHYLAHPDQAAAIAGRGQRRAHTEHTYEARLREIFRVLDRATETSS